MPFNSITQTNILRVRVSHILLQQRYYNTRVSRWYSVLIAGGAPASPSPNTVYHTEMNAIAVLTPYSLAGRDRNNGIKMQQLKGRDKGGEGDFVFKIE